jgi:hypothetical protein
MLGDMRIKLFSGNLAYPSGLFGDGKQMAVRGPRRRGTQILEIRNRPRILLRRGVQRLNESQQLIASPHAGLMIGPAEQDLLPRKMSCMAVSIRSRFRWSRFFHGGKRSRPLRKFRSQQGVLDQTDVPQIYPKGRLSQYWYRFCLR